jgi:hypothetical protein
MNYAIFLGGSDECSRAADIYQCGRERAPTVTSVLQSRLTPSSAILAVCSFLPCVMHLMNCSLIEQNQPILPSVTVDLRYCRFENEPCIVDVS